MPSEVRINLDAGSAECLLEAITERLETQPTEFNRYCFSCLRAQEQVIKALDRFNKNSG